MTPSDYQELIKSAQGGDRKAMDQVIEDLRPYLAKIAAAYVDPIRPIESTADLLQESCLRAWNKIGSFEGGSNDEETFAMFRAWIGQIVRRLGMDAKRDHDRKRRRPEQKLLRLDIASPGISTTSGGSIQPFAREESPSFYAREGERAEQVRSALESLPDETDASIVRMYFFDKLKLTEIISTQTQTEGGAWVVPLPHSSGASRWHQIAENQLLIDKAIGLIRGHFERLFG